MHPEASRGIPRHPDSSRFIPCNTNTNTKTHDSRGTRSYTIHLSIISCRYEDKTMPLECDELLVNQKMMAKKNNSKSSCHAASDDHSSHLIRILKDFLKHNPDANQKRFASFLSAGLARSYTEFTQQYTYPS